MMRAPLQISFALAVTAALACRVGNDCPATPCPSAAAYFYSPCGFKSITSTCSGFVGFDAGSCTTSSCNFAIKGVRAETCTVSLTYGNGTPASTTLTFTDGDDCCPGVHTSNGVHFPPSTCVGDAGADSSIDARVDGSTDASNDGGNDP
ncbi:hypothetical protein BH09MYX1_BH09MYX1_22610 [soil metagenome]